jgi:hypothetical protein
VAARAPGAAASSEVTGAPALPATSLDLRDLFEAHSPDLRPSDKVRALAGQRVRLVGFMAEMELPPQGAFYLTPRPVHCDEAGGGTADLPPETVLVIVSSAKGQSVPYLRGALEAIGVLDIGNRAGVDGRVSAFRLVLDGSSPSPQKEGKK